jgi:hypothetical protein
MTVINGDVLIIGINITVVMSQIFAENNVTEMCWILFEREKQIWKDVIK